MHALSNIIGAFYTNQFKVKLLPDHRGYFILIHHKNQYKYTIIAQYIQSRDVDNFNLIGWLYSELVCLYVTPCTSKWGCHHCAYKYHRRQDWPQDFPALMAPRCVCSLASYWDFKIMALIMN